MPNEMNKHTPGPWRVGPVDDTVVTDAAGNEVAAIDGDYNDPDLWPLMEANARLIAAAPNMLAALERAFTDLTAVKKFTEWCHDSPPSLQDHMNEGLPSVIETLAVVRAAIAATRVETCNVE